MIRPPRAVRAAVVVVGLGWGLMLIATAALGFKSNLAKSWGTLAELVLLISGPVLIAWGVFTTLAHKRRVKKLAQDNNFHLCPRCHYPLDGLHGEGLCPECGGRFSLAGVEAAWRAYR